MFLMIFFKTQNIVQTMHLTMLIAHPNPLLVQIPNFYHFFDSSPYLRTRSLDSPFHYI